MKKSIRNGLALRPGYEIKNFKLSDSHTISTVLKNMLTN